MPRPSQQIRLTWIVGVATVLGLFSTSIAIAFQAMFSLDKTSYAVLVGLNVTYWYAWAVLTPGMLWMARRYSFARGSWGRTALVHLPAVLAFTLAHGLLATGGRMVTVYLLNEASLFPGYWPSFRRNFLLNIDFDMMTYWFIVGLSHALDYRRQSEERALRTAQLETRVAEAQLQALQRQLHPHFLFNTLHTISALMHRDTEAADAMLARLSDLLRLTLDRIGTQVVTLREELDFLQKYLEIEHTRFGDRLQLHFDIDPALLDAAVPNLILQPLVENALRHGIGPKVGGGRIDVMAKRDHEALTLVVRDNGYGVPSETLTQFNTGIGLSNTRSRLGHLYGASYRFEFATPPGGGLEVLIAIPFSIDPNPAAGAAMESVA